MIVGESCEVLCIENSLFLGSCDLLYLLVTAVDGRNPAPRVLYETL